MQLFETYPLLGFVLSPATHDGSWKGLCLGFELLALEPKEAMLGEY